MAKSWQDEYTAMISDCIESDDKLNDWERTFLDSLSAHLGAGRTLTEKQLDKLNDLWERISK
jgi:hypothetical protein